MRFLPGFLGGALAGLGGAEYLPTYSKNYFKPKGASPKMSGYRGFDTKKYHHKNVLNNKRR